MNADVGSGSPCCSGMLGVGGVAPSDVAALDALAIKLIGLDAAFAAPLRELGRVLGRRIAAEHERRPLGDALDALIPGCGFEGVVHAEFLARTDVGAVLKLQGCAQALGWPVPLVQRTVCSYDEGLFEGFLSGLTADPELTVSEVACLGLGHTACQFAIAASSSAARNGVHHAQR